MISEMIFDPIPYLIGAGSLFAGIIVGLLIAIRIVR